MSHRQTTLRPEQGGKFRAPVVGTPTRPMSFPWGDAKLVNDEANRLVGKECCVKGDQTRAGLVGTVEAVRLRDFSDKRRQLFKSMAVAVIYGKAGKEVEVFASLIEPVEMVDSGVCYCGVPMSDHRSYSSCAFPSDMQTPKYLAEGMKGVIAKVKAWTAESRDVLNGDLKIDEDALFELRKGVRAAVDKHGVTTPVGFSAGDLTVIMGPTSAGHLKPGLEARIKKDYTAPKITTKVAPLVIIEFIGGRCSTIATRNAISASALSPRASCPTSSHRAPGSAVASTPLFFPTTRMHDGHEQAAE